MINKNNKQSLMNDVNKIKFIKGTSYKYQALIPKNIWNKWRPDKTKMEYKKVNFGKPGYQQYHDKIGKWSKYDHHDSKRRLNYQARHKAIMITINDKKHPSYKVPFTREFFAYWMLW